MISPLGIILSPPRSRVIHRWHRRHVPGGGGILTHNVPALHYVIEAISEPGVLGTGLGILPDLVVGVIVVAVVLGLVKLNGKLRRKPAAAAAKKPA
jgi:hypothetical protein